MKLKLREVEHGHVMSCHYCEDGVLRCVGTVEEVKGEIMPLLQCEGCDRQVRLVFEGRTDGPCHIWLRRTVAEEDRMMAMEEGGA